MVRNFFLFGLSFVIVAWGQPDVSWFFCLLSSGFGFALFWKILFSYPSKKKRFLLSTLWFTAVQSVQLFWLATPEYQGSYIFFVYGALALFLGIQFGMLSLLFPEKPPLIFKKILGIASVWTLIEWSRLYLLCGFAWNPIGLSMTAFPISSQLASLWGVFGLSFWTTFVNLLALSVMTNRSFRQLNFALLVYLFPFVFGFVHIQCHDRYSRGEKTRFALLQTALLPREKGYFYEYGHLFVSPYEQWRAMILYLEEKGRPDVDLIAMPESVVPFSARTFLYRYDDVAKILRDIWGSSVDWSYLLRAPLAEKREEWYVNNLFWAQAFADHYGAEIILGLDDSDEKKREHYNAAFHLMPHTQDFNRYEKQILLPLAEYLPFSFLKPLVARYGITDFFTPGTNAKVFKGQTPLSISICYEECFGHVMREGKLNGAQLFINVTNDAWYPFSRLPFKHYVHGRLRAIENGVPLLRACNTGVTAAIDSLGRTICQFGEKNLETEKGVLIGEIRLDSYSTLYTYLGNSLILAISLILTLFAFVSFPKST